MSTSLGPAGGRVQRWGAGLRLVMLIALIASVTTVATPTAAAQTTCGGKLVTVDLSLGQTATAGDDVIRGTDGDDVIAAGDGDDIICGVGGDDTIWGQLGDDVLRGGSGDDKLRGGDGDDKLSGGGGSDDLNGGRGNDEVNGDDGDDTKVRGGSGDDVIDGGDGNDVLIAGNGGLDIVTGGAGNDPLVTGGPRPDTVSGGPGDDIVKGHKGADTLRGEAGDDMLFGGPQPDTLDGGDGTDVCNGGTEDDTAVNCETELNLIESVTMVPPDASFISSHTTGAVDDAGDTMSPEGYSTGAVVLGGSLRDGATAVTVTSGSESGPATLASDGSWQIEVSPNASGMSDFTVLATFEDGTATTETVSLNLTAVSPAETLVTPEYANTPDLAGFLIAYDPDAGVLTFSGRHDETLLSDMVLVGDPSAIAPDGYLRIVQTVTFDGANTIVSSRQGAVTDVIRRAQVTETTTRVLRQSTASFGGDGVITAQSGPVKLESKVSALVTAKMHVEIDWCTGILCLRGPRPQIFALEATADGSINTTLSGTAAATAQATKTLFQVPPRAFAIGPVPVALDLRVDGVVKASVGGTLSVGSQVSIAGGAGYEWRADGTGRGSYSIPLQMTGTPSVSLEAKATASAELEFLLGLKVAGLIGPFIKPAFGVAFEAVAGTTSEECKDAIEWKFKAIASVGVGVETRLLFTDFDLLPTVEISLPPREWVLAGDKVLRDQEECPDDPPPEPPDPGPGSPTSGASFGHPVLVTFDQLEYTFHGGGDYVLAESTEDDFAVHVRYSRLSGMSDVSFNRALAARVGSSVVSFSDDTDTTAFDPSAVRVDGVEVDPTAGVVGLPGGAELTGTSWSYVLSWADGTILEVGRHIGDAFELTLAPSRFGKVRGLLGDADNEPDNDIVTRDGIPVDPFDFGPFYSQFGASWRLDASDSLFESALPLLDYLPVVPGARLTLADLPAADRAEAEAICRGAGIEPGAGLSECMFDIAMTGDPRWTAGVLAVADAVQNSVWAAALNDQLEDFDFIFESGTRTGGLDSPFVVDTYALELQQGTSIVVDAETCPQASTFELSLQAPSGRIIGMNQGEFCGRLGFSSLLETGTYNIHVYDTAGFTGAYSFDVQLRSSELCSLPLTTTVTASECRALVALYGATQGPLWLDSTGWLSDTDVCTWHGVTCTSGAVTAIELSANGLSGNIPMSIGDLSRLTLLDLSDNSLSGTIPSDVGDLLDLTALDLGLNSQLFGIIPTEIGNLIDLQSLRIGGTSISGAIPESIVALLNLTELTLPSLPLAEVCYSGDQLLVAGFLDGLGATVSPCPVT